LARENRKFKDSSPAERSGGKHDIYKDPALSAGPGSDPALDFIKRRWKVILPVIAIVLFGLYARAALEQTRTQSLVQASDLYSRVRLEYVEVANLKENLSNRGQNAPEEERELFEKQADRLSHSINALRTQRSPYSTIAEIYQILLFRATDNHEAIANVSEEAIAYEKLSPDNQNRFFLELQALTLARALLDNEDTYSRARQLLERLSSTGEHSHVPASLSLARVSMTEQERQETLEILKQVLARSPEQAVLLEGEISRLSV
jgi:lipopolysaccharide biosynthesis regulator YciM